MWEGWFCFFKNKYVKTFSESFWIISRIYCEISKQTLMSSANNAQPFSEIQKNTTGEKENDTLSLVGCCSFFPLLCICIMTQKILLHGFSSWICYSCRVLWLYNSLYLTVGIKLKFSECKEKRIGIFFPSRVCWPIMNGCKLWKWIELLDIFVSSFVDFKWVM